MSFAKTRSVSASAPGKVIILGEHFVVHGAYALAAAIDKRVKVGVSEEIKRACSTVVSNGIESSLLTKGRTPSVVEAVAGKLFEKHGKKSKIRIEIDSEIPHGSGLGSSGAVSVATTAALSCYLGLKLTTAEILKVASLGEKAVHGNPSGIDTETSLRGGVLLFSKKTGARSILLKHPIRLLVVFSGKRRKTSKLVMRVMEKKKKFPHIFELLSNMSSFESVQAAEMLETGKTDRLGTLMNSGQMRLSWIGVSNHDLDSIIDAVHQNESCYGAKLTGAGGGGSVIALPKPRKAAPLLQRISKDYGFSFLSVIPQEGLRVG